MTDMSYPSTTVPPRKGRGCWFYGCLTLSVMFLLALLLAVLAVRWVRNQVTAYTDAAPVTLPKVEMPAPEFQALNQRVTAFGQALEQGKAAEPLTLTELELNALLTGKPEMKPLADKVHVTLSEDRIKGQVSIPLQGLSWFGRGRYLNGEATFKVTLQNGVLIVVAEDVKVKGKPLPEAFMAAVRGQNLAEEATKDPENASAIGKLESIQIQDGRVIIKPSAPK
jgi:hypothetical protein